MTESQPKTTATNKEKIAAILVEKHVEARTVELENEIARLKRREAELLEANNLYLQRARDAEARVAELERGIFTIGDMTMEKVFRRNGITNLHNLQRVLDAVEETLISEAGRDSDDAAYLI